VFFAVDPDFFAAFDLAANINLRSRVVSHEHHGQTRPHSGGSHGTNVSRGFSADFCCDFGSIESGGGHESELEILALAGRHGASANLRFRRKEVD